MQQRFGLLLHLQLLVGIVRVILDCHRVEAGEPDLAGFRRAGVVPQQLPPGRVGVVALGYGCQPGVSDPLDVNQQLAVIGHGQRAIRQDFPRCEKLLLHLPCVIAGAGQQVRQREGCPVAQIGQGVAEQLQDRDARIMHVVVGPDAPAQPLHVSQSDRVQPPVVERRFSAVFFGYRCDHRYHTSRMLWLPAETRIASGVSGCARLMSIMLDVSP